MWLTNLLRRSAVTSIGVGLAACAATSVQPQWSGSQPHDTFMRDNYECVRDSRTSYGGSGWALLEAKGHAESQSNALHRMCMESKGYRLTCPPLYHLNDDRDKCKSN